jgi:hypothetical protein
MPDITIRYHIALEGGSAEEFELTLDERTLELRHAVVGALPSWTDLGFQQCPHCPLRSDTVSQCPAAVRLVPLVERFARVLSYEQASIEVSTAERTVTHATSAQQAVSSLMGLIMAVSGCPHTAFFRPMARFHLPGASLEETTYRAASMHMLAQYWVRRAGGEPDLDFTDLVRRYKDVQQVNRAFVKRLHAAAQADSTINALVVLDAWALSLPWEIAESLETLRPLFGPYLGE